jgi:hypothetical protein
MAEKAEIVMEIDSNVGEVTKDVEKLDDATKKGATGFKGMATAAKGFGLALKAAGIGLIVAAFMALKEALGRNQKVMNTVNTVMTTVSTTFNQVVGVLIDVYDWVTQSSERFNGLTKVISGLLTIALTPLKLSFYAIKLGVQGAMLAWENSFLGGGDEKKIAELRASIAQTTNDIKEVGLSAVDAGKDIFNNISDAIGEIQAIGEVAIKGISDISIKANYEQAKATTAAANSSKLAEAQLQGLIEKNDLLAETQRQIRDDETKTFEERIAANKELGEILKTQKIDMMELADSRVVAAKLELDANKENIDLQVAYQQTLNDRAGVEAQIAGFKSEQLTNEVSLNKELLESQREIAQEGLSGMEKELLELENSYKLKKEMARKSGMDTTDIDKQFAKQKADIVREQVNTQLEAFGNLAGALGALAGESKELAIAEAIISTYVGANKAFAQGGVAGFVTGTAVILAGLANVQKIMQQDVGGGGGGSVGATAQTPAPQMMQGAFTLGGGIEPEPARAYVVSDDITNNQNKLAIIRRRATI